MLTARAPRLVAFDLDGTLVDSVPDIDTALQCTLADLGRPPVPMADTRRWIGNGVPRLLHRALSGSMDGSAEAGLLERAQRLFLAHYARSNGQASRVYAGARECLQALHGRGTVLACITNKPQAPAGELLAGLGLDGYFGLLLGGDSLTRRKPDPLPLRHAAAHFGVPHETMVMVGDSMNDVQAARATPCPVICVRYGYNHGHDIAETEPDAVLDNLAELPALLLGSGG